MSLRRVLRGGCGGSGGWTPGRDGDAGIGEWADTALKTVLGPLTTSGETLTMLDDIAHDRVTNMKALPSGDFWLNTILPAAAMTELKRNRENA